MTGKHYNPIWMTSIPQMVTFPLILPALTWFDDQVQPVPDLARDIDINPDATVYTFYLPEEATWSDGEPLTADDVLFTYELALHPAIGQSVWVNAFSSIEGVTAYQEGEAAEIPADELERFRAMEHVDVLSVQGIGYHVTHIDFRNEDQIRQLNLPADEGGKGYDIPVETKPYLQDPRFRQALAYAVDANSVIQVVAGGEATPIYSPIFGPDWAVNPDLNTYERDVEQAKALMEEAGVEFNEDGIALWEGEPITLVYLSNTGEEARQLGEVLQQQFGDIGIRLDIKLVTSSAFISAAINGEGDLIRNAGGRFGADPSVSSLYYTCSAGWAELVIGYCNPEFDALMEEGVAVSDPNARQEIYWEASAILNDELPSLFFFTANRFFGVNKGLGGVNPSADPGYLTWNIEEWFLK